MLDDGGETDTDATGSGAGPLTVIAADEVFPSLAAEIVAVPAATAVTRPDVETALMAGLLEVQLMTRPVSTLLLPSRVTAESCTVPPNWSVEVAGETDMDATGIGAGALTLKPEAADTP
jgi:hypothetical protein